MLFQVRPGAATYSEAVQQKKKVAIICESMPKSINLSGKLGRTTIVYSKTFPGVNSVHMNHHIISALLKDKPDIVTVHAGINDVLNRCYHQKYQKISSRYTSHAEAFQSCHVKTCQNMSIKL